MNPIHHVAALPGMVATEGLLQATRGIELIRPLRCLERHIKSFQFRFLGGEIFRRFFVPIQPENPIVVRALGQQNRGIPERDGSNFRDGRPVVPYRRLRHHEPTRGLLLIKHLQLAAKGGGWLRGHRHAFLELDPGLGLGVRLPVRLAFDRPVGRCGQAGGEDWQGGAEGGKEGFFHLVLEMGNRGPLRVVNVYLSMSRVYRTFELLRGWLPGLRHFKIEYSLNIMGDDTKERD